MSIFGKLFRKKEKSNKNESVGNSHPAPPPSNQEKVDLYFEALVSQSKESGSGEDIFQIWKHVLGLKEWHYISIYDEDIQMIKPFVGIIDDRNWLFMFTSPEKAKAFAKLDNRFYGPNGETFFITQTVEASLDMIARFEMNGVFGLMVNMNDLNIGADFNIPLSVLNNIKAMIDEGK